MSGKNDIVFVKHVLESIDAINDFSAGVTKEELTTNRMKRSAIVREIEIIGEAAKNISKETRSKYGEIKWKEIAATRDKMIHHYFGVDLDIVLAIIRKDLPKLRKGMLEIENDLGKQ